jgi:Mg-chelatase subunit ChlD
LAAAAAIRLARGRSRRRQDVAFSSFLFLDDIDAGSWRTRLRWVPPALRWGAIVLAALSAARPEYAAGAAETAGGGLRLMLVLDVSGSMGVREEFGENGRGRTRLSTSKEAVERLLEGGALGPADQVGVVAAAQRPRIACPLTRERAAARAAVAALEVDRTGDRTGLGDGIALALEALGEGGPERLALVYSDGAHNVERSLSLGEAARIAQAKGIRIGAVLVRGRSGGESPQEEADRRALEGLGEATGGVATQVDDWEGVDGFVREASRAARRESAASEREWRDVSAPFAVGALLALVLELVLRRTAFGFAGG